MTLIKQLLTAVLVKQKRKSSLVQQKRFDDKNTKELFETQENDKNSSDHATENVDITLSPRPIFAGTQQYIAKCIRNLYTYSLSVLKTENRRHKLLENIKWVWYNKIILLVFKEDFIEIVKIKRSTKIYGQN